MTDLEPAAHEPSLAEVTARRVAARSEWQKALARAKNRFAPSSVKNEMIDNAADAIGGAADKAVTVAWAHRGKLLLAGLLGGLVVARKPVTEVAGPLADKAKASINKAGKAIADFTKR